MPQAGKDSVIKGVVARLKECLSRLSDAGGFLDTQILIADFNKNVGEKYPEAFRGSLNAAINTAVGKGLQETIDASKKASMQLQAAASAAAPPLPQPVASAARPVAAAAPAITKRPTMILNEGLAKKFHDNFNVANVPGITQRESDKCNAFLEDETT